MLQHLDWHQIRRRRWKSMFIFSRLSRRLLLWKRKWESK